MFKFIIILTILICLGSCSKIGYYYTDPGDNDLESIQLNDDVKIKSIRFAAKIIDTMFSGIIYFKLLDTTTIKDFKLEELTIRINDVPDSAALKKLSCIDIANDIEYEDVEKIPQLTKEIETAQPLVFYYNFNENDIPNNSRINVSIKMSMSENGNKSTLEKRIQMRKHTRYRAWLANS